MRVLRDSLKRSLTFLLIFMMVISLIDINIIVYASSKEKPKITDNLYLATMYYDLSTVDSTLFKPENMIFGKHYGIECIKDITIPVDFLECSSLSDYTPDNIESVSLSLGHLSVDCSKTYYTDKDYYNNVNSYITLGYYTLSDMSRSFNKLFDKYLDNKINISDYDLDNLSNDESTKLYNAINSVKDDFLSEDNEFKVTINYKNLTSISTTLYLINYDYHHSGGNKVTSIEDVIDYYQDAKSGSPSDTLRDKLVSSTGTEYVISLPTSKTIKNSNFYKESDNAIFAEKDGDLYNTYYIDSESSHNINIPFNSISNNADITNVKLANEVIYDTKSSIKLDGGYDLDSNLSVEDSYHIKWSPSNKSGFDTMISADDKESFIKAIKIFMKNNKVSSIKYKDEMISIDDLTSVSIDSIYDFYNNAEIECNGSYTYLGLKEDSGFQSFMRDAESFDDMDESDKIYASIYIKDDSSRKNISRLSYTSNNFFNCGIQSTRYTKYSGTNRYVNNQLKSFSYFTHAKRTYGNSDYYTINKNRKYGATTSDYSSGYYSTSTYYKYNNSYNGYSSIIPSMYINYGNYDDEDYSIYLSNFYSTLKDISSGYTSSEVPYYNWCEKVINNGSDINSSVYFKLPTYWGTDKRNSLITELDLESNSDKGIKFLLMSSSNDYYGSFYDSFDDKHKKVDSSYSCGYSYSSYYQENKDNWSSYTGDIVIYCPIESFDWFLSQVNKYLGTSFSDVYSLQKYYYKPYSYGYCYPFLVNSISIDVNLQQPLDFNEAFIQNYTSYYKISDNTYRVEIYPNFEDLGSGGSYCSFTSCVLKDLNGYDLLYDYLLDNGYIKQVYKHTAKNKDDFDSLLRRRDLNFNKDDYSFLNNTYGFGVDTVQKCSDLGSYGYAWFVDDNGYISSLNNQGCDVIIFQGGSQVDLPDYNYSKFNTYLSNVISTLEKSNYTIDYDKSFKVEQSSGYKKLNSFISLEEFDEPIILCSDNSLKSNTTFGSYTKKVDSIYIDSSKEINNLAECTNRGMKIANNFCKKKSTSFNKGIEYPITVQAKVNNSAINTVKNVPFVNGAILYDDESLKNSSNILNSYTLYEYNESTKDIIKGVVASYFDYKFGNIIFASRPSVVQDLAIDDKGNVTWNKSADEGLGIDNNGKSKSDDIVKLESYTLYVSDKNGNELYTTTATPSAVSVTSSAIQTPVVTKSAVSVKKLRGMSLSSSKSDALFTIPDEYNVAGNVITVYATNVLGDSDEVSVTIPAKATPTPVITSTPTSKPSNPNPPVVVITNTPEVTSTPTVEPTVEPTTEPTSAPTVTPVVVVSASAIPTVEPTNTPVVTVTPSAVPTISPTIEPTVEPTIVPTEQPTDTPVPTVEPTVIPTINPTDTPEPIVEPTKKPTTTPKPASTKKPTTTSKPISVPTLVPYKISIPEPTDKPEIVPLVQTGMYDATKQLTAGVLLILGLSLILITIRRKKK